MDNYKRDSLANEQQWELFLKGCMRQLLQPINRDYYVIGQDIYKNFLSKNPNRRATSKIVIGEYYVVNVNKDVYDNYVFHNEQQGPASEQQLCLRLQHFMENLMLSTNHGYIVGKEKFESFSGRISTQQVITRPIIACGEYYIIKKETYGMQNVQLSNPEHQELSKQLPKFMRQLVQPIARDHYILGKESYENYNNYFLNKKTNQQNLIARPTRVNGDYYIISKECKEIYDKYLQQENTSGKFQLDQFMQLRILIRINFRDKDYYVIGKENYDLFFKKININQTQQVISETVGPITIDEEYCLITITKEDYDRYLLENRPECAKITPNSHNGVHNQESLYSDNLQSPYRELEKKHHNGAYNQESLYSDNPQSSYRELGKKHHDGAYNQESLYSDNPQSSYRELGKKHHNGAYNQESLYSDNPQSSYRELGKKHHDGAYNQESLYSDNPQSSYQELEKKYKNLKIQKHNEIIDLKSQIQTLEKNNQLLNNRNSELKDEVSKYQSALGDATSFHLGNQDSNSTSQLLNDIRNLHYKLEKFCGTKKGVKIVNELEVRALLGKYNCSTDGIKLNKNLVSAVLERNVIETIIDKTNEYFDRGENDKYKKDKDEKQQQSLEANIVNTTKQLLEMTEVFSTIRTGTDEVSKAAPTKLRQQIYSVLGHRGFSKTDIDKKDSKEHPLILKLQKDISDLMNRYREITHKEKLAEIEKNTNEIVRQVVNIFFFRLKVQEPVAEWKWFPNNNKINTLMMEGSYDKGDLEDLRVDVCAFPLIGSNLSSTNEKEKVIFPAQILAKEKETFLIL